MDELDLLNDAIAALLGDQCGISTVRAAEDDGRVPPDLWTSMRDSGFTRLSVPSSTGEAIGTLVHERVVLDQAGRFAAPLPLAEDGMLGGFSLAAAGIDLPAGIVTVAPGKNDDRLIIERSHDRWRVNADLRRVPYAESAERIVALFDSVEGTYVVSIPTPVATIERGLNVAGEPRDRVTVTDATLDPGDVSFAPAGFDSDTLRLRGALARAAQLAGAAQRALELTIDYTNTREQFGKKIGRFQAVARHLVRLAEHTHMARLSVATAFANAADRTDYQLDPFDVAAAKIIAGEAAVTVSRAAHQAHGAIGMTKEYELGQLTRRLWAWRDEYGSDRYWSTRMGESLVAQGADELWPRITTGRRSMSPA